MSGRLFRCLNIDCFTLECFVGCGFQNFVNISVEITFEHNKITGHFQRVAAISMSTSCLIAARLASRFKALWN